MTPPILTLVPSLPSDDALLELVQLEPEVLELAPVREGLPGGSVGDFMRVADALRVAIELVEIATSAAESSGAPRAIVARLRARVAELRKSI